jgi:UDP-glucuronate decarboxylase
MIEFAQKVAGLTGWRSSLVREPLPADDPRQRQPDITRARALGREPNVALDDGLAKTIDYFRAFV